MGGSSNHPTSKAYMILIWPPSWIPVTTKDYYMFARGFRTKPSLSTVTGRGPYPTNMIILEPKKGARKKKKDKELQTASEFCTSTLILLFPQQKSTDRILAAESSISKFCTTVVVKFLRWWRLRESSTGG